jgi:plasmid stability protein
MKNISVRGIDDETASRLKAEAARRKTSVNTLVVQLLRSGVGLRPEGPRIREFHDLDRLAGTWSEVDYREFMETQRDFSVIDEELWR